MNQQQPSEKVIEVLNQLSDNGQLDKLLRAGVIPPKVIGAREMYLQFDINRRVLKMKIKEAQLTVACKFNCNPKTVRRAIISMEKT